MTQQENFKQMDQDKIMQRYNEYKRAREQRLREDQQLQQAKTETQALWETKKSLADKVVTTRKAHVCHVCKRTIQPGEQATVKAELTNIATGSGYTAGFQTSYTCSSCKPTIQQNDREEA